MKRYYRDSDGSFKESASEAFLQHSTGKWDRSKTKYVKIVKSPSGRDAYLYPDDLEPGKKYGPKVGEKEEKSDIKDDAYWEKQAIQSLSGVSYPLTNEVVKKRAAELKAKDESESKRKETTKKAASIVLDLADKVTGVNTSAPTRGALHDFLFGTKPQGASASTTVSPKHLKAKPGGTSAVDTKKKSETTGTSTIGRHRSREAYYQFEKKSGATKWHAKEGTVGKGKSLNIHKQVGSTVDLDEFLKKLK